MNGMEAEIISREPRCELVRIFGGAVIEMPARAEQLDRGSSRARRFAQKGSRQFFIYKEIGGEDALDRHDVRALCAGMISTLCEASIRVKASPRRPSGGIKSSI